MGPAVVSRTGLVRAEAAVPRLTGSATTQFPSITSLICLVPQAVTTDPSHILSGSQQTRFGTNCSLGGTAINALNPHDFSMAADDRQKAECR
jgi:hypothetical protein